jgi:hypothetical protein
LSEIKPADPKAVQTCLKPVGTGESLPLRGVDLTAPEGTMADSTRQTTTTYAQTVFPPNLVEAQGRSTTLVTRANELIMNTARAVWESEMELFRLESGQVTKALVPLKLGDDPAATVSAYCEQWQQKSEKLLNHMRTVNDLVRKSGWDLFQIYQESLREAAKPFQSRSS